MPANIQRLYLTEYEILYRTLMSFPLSDWNESMCRKRIVIFMLLYSSQFQRGFMNLSCTFTKYIYF